MEDTVFDKIIRREIPAEIIYEDEHTVAFLDRAPYRPGHTLVVPKKRATNIFDIDAENFEHVMHTVHTLSSSIRAILRADGMHIALNNEYAGGQAVFYLHVHLVPTLDSDPIRHPEKPAANENDLKIMGEKIRAGLS